MLTLQGYSAHVYFKVQLDQHSGDQNDHDDYSLL
jgi:hypothetical protein